MWELWYDYEGYVSIGLLSPIVSIGFEKGHLDSCLPQKLIALSHAHFELKVTKTALADIL